VACVERALSEALPSENQPPLDSDDLRAVRKAVYDTLLRLAREADLKKQQQLLMAGFWR